MQILKHSSTKVDAFMFMVCQDSHLKKRTRGGASQTHWDQSLSGCGHVNARICSLISIRVDNDSSLNCRCFRSFSWHIELSPCDASGRRLLLYVQVHSTDLTPRPSTESIGRNAERVQVQPVSMTESFSISEGKSVLKLDLGVAVEALSRPDPEIDCLTSRYLSCTTDANYCFGPVPNTPVC